MELMVSMKQNMYMLQNGIEAHVATYSSMNVKIHQARNELLNAPSPKVENLKSKQITRQY